VDTVTLVDTATLATAAGTTPDAIRGHLRRGTISVAARRRRDRGRPELLFDLDDAVAKLAQWRLDRDHAATDSDS
jgi:predicted ArsR family transcriptional regulator